MPVTRVILSAPRAHEALQHMKYPFVSKGSHGADGKNVRPILTEANAYLEIDKAFVSRTGIGEPKQTDYLIWQDFLPGNPFTYRVVRVGSYEMLVRRYRGENNQFEPGLVEPVNELDGEANDVLYVARNFLDDLNTKFCAVDLALDERSNEWRILGITLNWKLSDFADCNFYGTNEHYHGYDTWTLLVDEIANGVFG
jgi:glutathione synthase/RimK-type ligase-like ATP-grasp enzyme